MKILVVGDWHSELHEEAVYRACFKLGHECFRFSWNEYFSPSTTVIFLRMIESFIKKFQNKFIIGPIVNKINCNLILFANQCQPDLIFIYRGTHIKPSTLKEIRKNHSLTIIMGYNNDDPFAEGHPYWLWRHFLSSVQLYDMVLAYRTHNLDDFIQAGAKKVKLLRSWFIPERNYPVQMTPGEDAQYGCDVVFIGHYEPDWRVEMLEEIVRNGVNLKIYGHGHDWDPVLRKSPLLRPQIPVQLAWGDRYNKVLCGAKIALCFFSKLNRDTYTRRCFEIPATGTLLLSEYSEDLATLFQEGVEADYFRSKNELLDKVRYYLNNEKIRKSVAAAGLQRVRADAHDVVSRMQQVIAWASEIREKEGISVV